MTGERAPPVLVEWVEQRSRGNPLYAIGLLRALVEEQADLSAPVLRRLPEGLAERVTGRLRELDDAAQRTMELLAVVGRRVDSRSLVGLSGENGDELTDTLDRLVQLRGVTEEEHGHELTYEIAHPLVAEAIYQGISAGRRRRLHREVGRRLLAAGRLGEAAPHFVAAADPGDDEAVGVLRDAVAAAEEAESYQEALTILNALVELLPAGDPRWADVVDALSWEAQWVVNHRSTPTPSSGSRRCGPWTKRWPRSATPPGGPPSSSGWPPSSAGAPASSTRPAGSAARPSGCSRRPATGAASSWPATSWPGSSC